MAPGGIAAVEAIVKENRRITVTEIAAHLDVSDGSAHHIVHDLLQFHKVSARWVPRQLTAELKQRRVGVCQEILKRFEAEGGGFLGRTATGDETWTHYQQPETKRATNGVLPRHQNRKDPPHNHLRGKVMVTPFWDERGVI